MQPLLYRCLQPLLCAVMLVGCDRAPDVAQSPMSPGPAGTSKAPAGPQFEGNFELADCSVASGWARSTTSDDPVTVEISNGDRKLGDVVAEIPRQDLTNAGKGSGKHGFSFPIPAEVKDGRTHTLHVRIAGTSSPIVGSPREITCPPAAAEEQ